MKNLIASNIADVGRIPKGNGTNKKRKKGKKSNDQKLS